MLRIRSLDDNMRHAIGDRRPMAENSTALFGRLKSDIVSLNIKSVFGLYTRELCTNVTHRLLDLVWIQYGKGAQHTSPRMSSIYEIW